MTDEPDAAERSQTIPEMSIDTRVIIDHILSKADDVVIPYSEFRLLTGRDPQGVGRGPITSAIRYLLNNHNVVVSNVRGVGYKRLLDRDKLGAGDAAINHIRRTSRRGFQKVTAVDNYAGLSDDEKIRHNTLGTILSMTAQVTRRNNVKKIESKVSAQAEMLPLAQTLEAFKG